MAEKFLHSPFISVEKITEQAEGGVEVSERSLDPTEDSGMNSRMLWLVCRIETKKTTEEIFDLLCDPMLAKRTSPTQRKAWMQQGRRAGPHPQS